MPPIMPIAPTEFAGTLDELFDNWIRPVLLDLKAVENFHRQCRAYYLESADPVFLIRMLKDLERGKIYRSGGGFQIRPTDNSPSWWIHYQLFSGEVQQFTTFSSLIAATPCHMFGVHLPVNISQSGWHVAHIFNVKDRNTDYDIWDRNELLHRTIRNIHPCNYFYIPKTDWQKYGGDPQIIAFFQNKFQQLYQPIWQDFLNLAGAKPAPASRKTVFYQINQKSIQENQPQMPAPVSMPGAKPENCVTYRYSRLCFKADVIEPLDMDAEFCVITPVGSFKMTKREFYRTFPNVIKSKSYREGRLYHYRELPQIAMQFKIN